MAAKYLGDEFDIHGGGLDLRFPHHENELAQSRAAGPAVRAATGCTTRCSTSAGEKMSKSVGNSLLVSEVVKRVRPIELRYYLAAPHYRSIDRVLRRGAGRGRDGLPADRGLRTPGGRASVGPSDGGAVPRRRSPTRWTTTCRSRRRSPCCRA